MTDQKQDLYRLRLHRPSEGKGGAITATVQISHGDELLKEQLANLSKPEEFEAVCELAMDVAGLSHDEAEGLLHAEMIDARRWIENQREGSGYEQPKYAGRAREIVDELAEQGRFLNSPIGKFYFNGITHVPVDVESIDMQMVVREKFGINSTERISTFLTQELVYRTHRFGEDVTLRHFSYYDAGKNVLYVDEQQGHFLKVTEDGVERLENGSEGVMFRPQSPWEPWTYTQTERMAWSFRAEVLDSVAFVEGDETPLTPAEQKMLLVGYCTAILFRDDMPTRPILAVVGDSDSGKSTLIRLIGKTLFGRDFDVDHLSRDKEDDFWDVTGSRVMVGWDNLDGRVKWLEDALATIATGVQRSKRKLYTDGEIVTSRPDTFIALTARTPRFRRNDVSTRLFLVQLAKRSDVGKESSGEHVLYEQLAENRDRYLSELVDRAQLALKVPRQDGVASPIRMADFYAVIRRLAIAHDDLEILDLAANKMRSAQAEFAAEDNPLILTLEDWVDATTPDGQHNWRREISAKDLYGELKERAEKLGYRFFISSPVALGLQLRESTAALEQRDIVFEKRRKGGRGAVYNIRRTEHLGEGQLM